MAKPDRVSAEKVPGLEIYAKAVRAAGGELVIEVPPDKTRANDSEARSELVWIGILLREAERRGESPRAFVEQHTTYSKAAAGRKIRAARELLAQDWRFQYQVDCYRFEDQTRER